MNKKSNQNEVNKSLKLLAKSSVFVFLGFFLSKFFTYLYRIIIARSFGPEVYGLFSLSLMILFLLLAFASLGIHEGTVRFIALYRGKKEFSKINYLFKYARKILLISAILISIILFFAAKIISVSIFNEPDLTIFLKILSLILPFYMIGHIYLSLIHGFEKIKIHSFISDFLLNLVKVIAILF